MQDSTSQAAGNPARDGNSYLELQQLIQRGDDTQLVFSAIVELARSLPGVTAACLYLLNQDDGGYEARAYSGGQEVPYPLDAADNGSGPGCWHLPVTTAGGSVGSLGVCTAEALSPETLQELQTLCFYAGIAIAQPKLAAQVEHYSNKIAVLNELNKLVASGVNLDRIMRTIAREAAFRFSADCCLAFFLPEEGADLELKGSFGCPPKTLPELVHQHGTQLGRALKLGGILSVPNIGVQQGHGLDFLSKLGIVSAHIAGIDFRGETLGAVVIGYRSDRELSKLEGDMLEEFTRGSAVAIANAKNQITLARYTGKLEELVEERTADLAVETARADQANKAKSQFVANMSHELRTPLTAIVGYSSVLAEGVFGDVNTQQADALKAICKAADHLKDLINDVLDVAKVEAGKDDPEPTEVEVFSLLEQVYKLMMQSAMGKGVRLVPLQQPEDPQLKALKCWVDPRHIRQILINLMSNAVKYTPSGGNVTLSVEVLGDKAKVTVTDTGVGIAHSDLHKVFERFNRSEDSYSKAQVGTGIGLSLTRHLVEMNGGKIGLESEVGKGSSFWILMPLANESAHVQAPGAGTTAKHERPLCRLDGLNVMIVDDNQLSCEVLKSIIDSVGGNAYIAHSVSEAKEIAHSTALDTALIDLAMPGESGIDLLDYLRCKCEKPLSTMPLIVVSACVFDKDKQEALNHGASTFIAKPFSPGDIVTKIRELTTSSVLNSF